MGDGKTLICSGCFDIVDVCDECYAELEEGEQVVCVDGHHFCQEDCKDDFGSNVYMNDEGEKCEVQEDVEEGVES